MKKYMAMLAAALLASGTACAQPAPSVDADPALWVVKDKDTTIYLFGTVHALKPGLSWFDEAVRTAFDESDELVLEIVQPDQATMARKVTELAVDRDGPPLSDKLNDEERKAYHDVLAGFGMPAAALDPFEPWFAGITLAVLPLDKLGYKQTDGAEHVLTAAAKAANKPVGELETVDQQLGYFDTLPEDEQLKFLNATVRDLPEYDSTFSGMIAAWSKGDPAALGTLMNESLAESPLIEKVLLTDRNRRWAAWITTRLEQPGTVFVAVGAGHLAGKNSVQQFLDERKIKVQRIKY